MWQLLEEPVWLLTLGGLLGLLVGSFLNVVIHRVPRMLERSWRYECALLLEDQKLVQAEEKSTRFNLLTPGSHCPQCGTAIKPWQNIPLISYLAQGGKCAHCKTRISLRYPIIEALTAAVTVFALWQFGGGAAGGLAMLFCWMLIALTFIDLDHQLLPDNITLPLLWLGLLANTGEVFVSLESAVWGAVAGYLSLWSVYWLFKLLTGKEGMGYGDFKLLAALGAWLGWQVLPLIVVLSSLVGAVLGSILLMRQKKSQSTPIPFGPFLAVAGIIALFWGDQLVAAYLQYSGV